MPAETAAIETPWLELRNVAPESADLYVYNLVGDLSGRAAESLAMLPNLGERQVNVRINSPGGNVFAGLAVYNALNAYAGRVVVYIDGLAASMASAIAMAGDEIRMAQNAMLMIHAPSGASFGVASDLRGYADMLEKLGDNLRDIYAARSGLKQDEVAAYMKAETWFTAAEALALGLCDAVEAAKTASAQFDLSRFKNTPATLAGGTAPIMPDNKPAATAATVTETTATTATAAVTFTAEAVAGQVQAATEAAHAAARVVLENVKAEHVAAINALRSGKDSEIAELRRKLTEAEALSAANIGASPVANVTTSAAAPSAPAEILAHYRGLTGSARSEFFAKNSVAIWAAHEAEMTQPR